MAKINTGTTTIVVSENRSIIVLQSGWVFVGTKEHETEQTITYSDAATIRVWGTTKGLGELAINGATATTVLDKCGHLVVNKVALLFTIPVSSDL